MRRWKATVGILALIVLHLGFYSCDILGIGEDDSGGGGGGGGGSPDLVTTSVELNGTDTVESITLNIENSGSAGASDFDAAVVFWEYDDSEQDGVGDQFYVVHVFAGLSLSAGKSTSPTVQWGDLDLSELPAVTADYWVFGFADASGTISESNEDNNGGVCDYLITLTY